MRIKHRKNIKGSEVRIFRASRPVHSLTQNLIDFGSDREALSLYYSFRHNAFVIHKPDNINACRITGDIHSCCVSGNSNVFQQLAINIEQLKVNS